MTNEKESLIVNSKKAVEGDLDKWEKLVARTCWNLPDV